jgi:hypothetical protein
MSRGGTGATGRRVKLQWLPPMLVGASGAVAAEVAIGLLLYGGPGFIRSLTMLLAAESAAFAAGLWSAPREGEDLIDRLRLRWLLCLVSFLVAAVFGTVWSLEMLGQGRLAQGAGLAILAGLPLYAVGGVLGGISSVVRSDAERRLSGPGPAAAAGAAFGFVLTGVLLPRAPMPASLLVASLVMLSLGGMIFGGVLSARTEVGEVARRPVRSGDVRVLTRRRPADGLSTVELWEGSHVRRVLPLEGAQRVPWDVACVREVLPNLDMPFRIVMIGGGASPAPQAIVREHPKATVEVLERTGAVVELGRDHFATGLAISRGDRLSVGAGNIEDQISALAPVYDALVIDTSALTAIGGIAGLSAGAVDRLRSGLAPRGLIIWGPLPIEPGRPEIPDGWGHAAYARRASGGSAGESVLFARVGLDVDWPEPFDDFLPSAS